MFTEGKFFKTLTFIFLSFSLVLFINEQARAQGSELDDKIRQKENIYPTTGSSSNIISEAGALEAISGVLARVINIATWVVGIVFVGMLLVAAIKYAMSQGDPKGLEGAKNTITYAVFGFIVVIGFFAISGIVAKSVGQEGLLTNPVGKLEDNIVSLRDKLTELGDKKWYDKTYENLNCTQSWCVDTEKFESRYTTTAGVEIELDAVEIDIDESVEEPISIPDNCWYNDKSGFVTCYDPDQYDQWLKDSDSSTTGYTPQDKNGCFKDMFNELICP